MKKDNNKFTYSINNGSVSGFFNVYQAKSGKIYIQMAASFTELSLKQVHELHINVYELDQFDYDLFNEAYKNELDCLQAKQFTL